MLARNEEKIVEGNKTTETEAIELRGPLPPTEKRDKNMKLKKKNKHKKDSKMKWIAIQLKQINRENNSKENKNDNTKKKREPKLLWYIFITIIEKKKKKMQRIRRNTSSTRLPPPVVALVNIHTSTLSHPSAVIGHLRAWGR